MHIDNISKFEGISFGMKFEAVNQVSLLASALEIITLSDKVLLKFGIFVLSRLLPLVVMKENLLI